MGNTSSERAQRRDSRGSKEGGGPKILMDSPEDADIFHGEDMKVSCAGASEMGSRRFLHPGEIMAVVLGSLGERGVPCVAAGLGRRRQRADSGPTNGLSLDRGWQGGLPLRILQQLGQQDSSHTKVSGRVSFSVLH